MGVWQKKKKKENGPIVPGLPPPHMLIDPAGKKYSKLLNVCEAIPMKCNYYISNLMC